MLAAQQPAGARPGFFDTYQKEDKLYLAIPRDRLGKDFLMEMKIAQGIGANGLFGGTMLADREGAVGRAGGGASVGR